MDNLDTRLDRRVPTDWRHVERYGATLETLPAKPTPVIFGVNWYRNFYFPQKDEGTGKLWIGRGDLGRVMGGHAICSRPSALKDSKAWWEFYDQGQEGACVGFASSRAMTLLNRIRYGAHWLYKEAQLIDEWPETPPEEGTSVRAAIDVLRDKGHARMWGGLIRLPADRKHGVEANRWCKTVDEVIACLMSPEYYDIGGIPLLNSWGKDYPHEVWIPLDVVQRLLNEYGEATYFVDRI